MRHRLTVADVMTTDVVTVPEHAGFKVVAETLAEHHISAVPVIGSAGTVVGVVSETDLLRKEEFQRAAEAPWVSRWWQRRRRAKAAAVTAGELMTRPAVTVVRDSTIDEAARLMAARDITRLVVTDADGYFLDGIVTRSDLLSAYVATDREILRRVRLDVLQHALWDDPFGVEVSVSDGVVTLAGELDNRSLVPIAEKLTREVDGVVDVRNNLTWAFDDTVTTRN
ncbi:CBS domain protein [Kribbella voronezhensis]|uniref:CBS domain protein n=1 Tax=Kribbella voronezhensis TaxID=2512212 RepID=A0A4R7SWU1_9ACTN|nr:CBS domain-containing protein [Kribbella voronezhensis]TDU83830.1 CBS domain protein [Kribbella voronezhensis]